MIEVSREEIEDAKAALKAIDARPIKKVAEARARKKKRVATKIAAARSKANAIAAQEDVPMASKMKEIEKVCGALGAGRRMGACVPWRC